MSEHRLLAPGEPAPGFALPAVNRDGRVSLEDFRGRSAVLVGLYRGLHCPFCRRQIARLAVTQDKLKALDVETVAIVNTEPERARLYFRYRPTRVLLAADPEAATHRDYGAPAIVFVDDEAHAQWPRRATMREFQSALINPTGELDAPRNGFEANAALNQRDGFELHPVDERIMAAHGTQLVAHFLIDRQGVIRWHHLEAAGRVEDLAKFPSDDELLAAARALG